MTPMEYFVEFGKIFTNTFFLLAFVVSVIAVPVCVIKMLKAQTDIKADKYLYMCIDWILIALASLFFCWLTKEWGIQIW